VSGPLKIWTNAQLPDNDMEALVKGAQPSTVTVAAQTANNLAATAGDPDLAEADIAFGQPDPEQVIALPNLRWVQLTSAGYTRYDRPDLFAAVKARAAVLTNSSSVYNEPCAQHLLAFMLAVSRCLPESWAAQRLDYRWEYDRLRPQTRLLTGQNLALVGYGAIARRLIELLEPFHMNLVAFRRQPRGDELAPTYPIGDLLAHLAGVDHVVDILPATEATNGFFNDRIFSAFRPGCSFYNIGRGTTVDQPALLAALDSGHVGTAYIDVTDPEPLPTEHPLWSTPNCYITPHIGGGYQTEYTRLVEHFLKNLRRFDAGEPLQDTLS